MGDDGDGAKPPQPADDTGWLDSLARPLIQAASAARIGISVVSLDPLPPRMLYVNDAAVDILGHPRETLMQRPATAFLAPEERPARAATLEDAARPSIRSFETVALARDGRRVPLEVSVVEVQLAGRAAVVVFSRDISQRHSQQAALERSDQRLRRLIEHAPDAVWVSESGRRLLYANPATARMLHYETLEQVMALDPFEIVHPEDRAAMRDRSIEMLRSGESLPPREYRVRRRDGVYINTEVHSMPIEWEGVPAILGFARDVTARKEMEARLQRSDRLAALGTLLAGIAHEMNNPLTFALLGLEQAGALLERGGPVQDPARWRALLADVRHGVDRVAGVVRQLRVSSQPDAVERDRQLCDVAVVLQSALRVAGNELRHRARLQVDIGQAGPVYANPQRLEQVFLNLLVNATQALPDGRGDNEIRVVLRGAGGPGLPGGDGGRVTVEIADNGVGIAPEALPRVFDPFFTTKPVGVGMGLGLSICHGIIASMDGTIQVDSEPGRGARFRVVLPAASPTAPPPRRPATGEASGPARAPAAGTGAARGGPRRRVLVVDDEAALCEMVRRLLGGCEVDVALDAASALAQLTRPEAAYDVVLCDLMMPGMTGMDLYDEVQRTRPELAGRFVFMTGGAFTPRAREFLARVEAPLMEKPFDRRALEAMVGLTPA
jgi:PAS domain S-box-containing protein